MRSASPSLICKVLDSGPSEAKHVLAAISQVTIGYDGPTYNFIANTIICRVTTIIIFLRNRQSQPRASINCQAPLMLNLARRIKEVARFSSRMGILCNLGLIINLVERDIYKSVKTRGWQASAECYFYSLFSLDLD